MSGSACPPVLRIGTRGSELALAQAREVTAAIARREGAPETELVVIRTTGDRRADASLVGAPRAGAGEKGLFTREIEEALLRGEIDLAVHSLKDLASELPPGLALGAVLPREDPRDVLIVRRDLAASTLEELPRGARVGTCSPRRRALVARWRGDLALVDLRGNVPTRLARLEEGRCDALVLAAAGLARLGLTDRIRCHLPLERVLPAPGQGAIALELRAVDAVTRGWIAALNDPATWLATLAERAFLRRLEGGCQVPVGALGRIEHGHLELAGIVCSLDGRLAVPGQLRAEVARRSDAAAHAERLGGLLAQVLLERGAGAILGALDPPPRDAA